MIVTESEFFLQAEKRDQIKHRFLLGEAPVPRSEPCWRMRFEMSGVTVSLQGREPLTAEGERYLQASLAPFMLADPVGPADTTVYYQMAPEGHHDIRSDLWQNPDPTYWILDGEGASWDHVERDFAARVSRDFSQCFVLGPQLDDAASDTMDNLLAFLLPKFLNERGGMFLHSSAVIRDNQAYVFFGESGAGKSTLAAQCGHEEGLLVVGTDQTVLRHDEGEVWVQACTRKSPEFPRGHAQFSFDRYPVAGLMHLVNRGRYGFQRMAPGELLPLLVRESYLYIPGVLDYSRFVEVCCRLVSKPGLLLGEVSYPKGQPVWKAWESVNTKGKTDDGKKEEALH